jgi:hypothetical protein
VEGSLTLVRLEEYVDTQELLHRHGLDLRWDVCWVVQGALALLAVE